MPRTYLLILICVMSLSLGSAALAQDSTQDSVQDSGRKQLVDSDQDGFPDIVEITSAADRRNFLDWFATIAESQYTAIADTWEYQDCSGLLRYAFIRALEPKTSSWHHQFPFLTKEHIPEVSSLSYPFPELSRSVFRNQAGNYQANDIDVGRLVGLAASEELMNHSSVYLGRTKDVAVRGDLLYFIHPLAEGSGYHSMVYLGNDMIVYHTGLSPEEGGEVRLLSLETLAKHPDASWHPVPENPNFLGFYRWKIVH